MARRTTAAIASSISTLVLFGCAEGTVDIGEKGIQHAKSDLTTYAGVWDGYVEALQFEDGTDRVRIRLDEQGKGTFRFGERELSGIPTGSSVLSIGIEYPVLASKVESERLRLRSSFDSLLADYCAQQTPYAFEGELGVVAYRCIPYSAIIPVSSVPGGACLIPDSMTNAGYVYGDPLVEIDCHLLTMCNSYGRCRCDATGCKPDASGSDIQIDAALDDTQDRLTGTLLISNQRYAIHLSRQ